MTGLMTDTFTNILLQQVTDITKALRGEKGVRKATKGLVERADRQERWE